MTCLMSIYKNLHNMGDQLGIQPFKNGVKLVTLDDGVIPHRWSVSRALELPFNVYFMDIESNLVSMNENTVTSCGFQSFNDAQGSSMRRVAKKDVAEYVIAQDRRVVNSENRVFVDVTYQRLQDDICLPAVVLKFPWYDVNNTVIGVFGCGIVLTHCSIANALFQVSQLGILNPALIEPIHPSLGFDMNGVYLSKSEVETLRILVRGKSAREIALILKLSRRTVEHRIENIKGKVGASTKSELIDKVIDQIH